MSLNLTNFYRTNLKLICKVKITLTYYRLVLFLIDMRSLISQLQYKNENNHHLTN